MRRASLFLTSLPAQLLLVPRSQRSTRGSPRSRVTRKRGRRRRSPLATAIVRPKEPRHERNADEDLRSTRASSKPDRPGLVGENLRGCEVTAGQGACDSRLSCQTHERLHRRQMVPNEPNQPAGLRWCEREGAPRRKTTNASTARNADRPRRRSGVARRRTEGCGVRTVHGNRSLASSYTV